MRRQFIVGAAVTLAVLVFGLRMELRLPDQAGPGEEQVSFHGIPVYRREITKADAGRHSPYPALAVAYGTVAVGALLGGGVFVLLNRFRTHAFLRGRPYDPGFESKGGD